MIDELVRWRSCRSGRVLINEFSEESEALGSSPGLHILARDEQQTNQYDGS